jgi:N-acyl-D-aspartate/D-glutamate deacylase
MLDIKIVNGKVVDGTRQPRFEAEIGIKDGKIVAIGDCPQEAATTIDAGGRIVAPGFIDVHTHYDAQAFWDPTLSPSCYHGVTTVVGGFCGFSIAPMTADAATYLKPMLARVEGMPIETLDQAVPWGDWSTFAEFLALLEGKVGLNIGFFCGHSAIRRIVMGERAVGDKATPEDLDAMKSLLAASLGEGALGFSTTVSPTHSDADGNPVPSRWADHSELVELSRVVKDFAGTGLELLPDGNFGPGMAELLAECSVAGQRPVNWNVLVVFNRPDAAQRVEQALRVSDEARARGGEVIALTIPAAPNLFVNLHTGVGFDSNPGLWREVFKWPVSERIARFSDPEFRRQMAADLAEVPPEDVLHFKAQLQDYDIVSVETPQHKKYEGRSVGEIAAEEGREPIDVMLDIAVADGLRTTFATRLPADDKEIYELRAQVWRDDRTIIGGSDAGAHLDMIDTFAFSTTALEKGVREYGVITLEELVYQLTERPARYFGLVDRGRIAVGNAADIVIFDEAQVGRGATYMRPDVPGGASRIYADAKGIDHVLVNGIQIIRNGEHTGELPGSVLRSGRDTRTVLPGDMREDQQRV